MASSKITIGRYVRVMTAARVDVIGKIVRHTSVGYVVRVPNWTADGMDMEWNVYAHEVQLSSYLRCLRAARNR